jgi:hypothetical protein
MIAWTPFYNPLPLEAGAVIWLLAPLFAGVAIVYKTVRTERLRKLPGEILVLLLYMAAGLLALGVGLWLFATFWP